MAPLLPLRGGNIRHSGLPEKEEAVGRISAAERGRESPVCTRSHRQTLVVLPSQRVQAAIVRVWEKCGPAKENRQSLRQCLLMPKTTKDTSTGVRLRPFPCSLKTMVTAKIIINT